MSLICGTSCLESLRELSSEDMELVRLFLRRLAITPIIFDFKAAREDVLLAIELFILGRHYCGMSYAMLTSCGCILLQFGEIRLALKSNDCSI